MQLEGQLQSEMANLEKYKADANTLIRKSSELKRTEIESLRERIRSYEENKEGSG